MADRVLFVASSPEDFIRGITVPQQMISDLLEISRLPPAVVDQIGNAVEAAPGFLDDTRLESLVKETIQTEAAVKAVVSALRNLRAETVHKTLDAVEKWREADPRHFYKFPDEAFKAVREALPRLVRHSAALDRYRKAKRLSTLTGHQAKQIEIVCDARPVFDRERSTIEGFVTQTTLKVVYEGQTDNSACIEVVLTPKMLAELLERAQKAQKKIQVLRESVERWIPNGLAADTLQTTDGDGS